ncbi:NUDIX domain-containing protein [Patescibacteria group bacterium]|nr:NUDIX domain-containing protein [Patescibacteria group bacterium]
MNETYYYRDNTIFSAGGLLVDEDKKKVYLLFKEATKEWLLPKGRQMPGETLEATAQREVFEETGYQNQVRELMAVQIRPDVHDPQKKKAVFWFYCSLLNHDQQLNTQDVGENFSGRWCDESEAVGLVTFDDDREFVRQVFRRVNLVAQSS